MTPEFKKRTVDYAVYWVVRLLICAIQACSLRVCVRFAEWMGWLAADVLKFRDKITTENLRRAYPQASEAQLQDVKRRMWSHLVLMICEIAHAPRKIHETNWYRHIHVRDQRQVVHRLLENRPLVMVSGHFGNFEISGFAAGLLGFPTYAIARELDNPYIHRFIDEFRQAKGQFMLSKDGSANQVQDLLSTKQTLLLLADQHAGPKGCWVDFFGSPASCHKAVAVFTLTADAPMVVCFVRRTTGPLQFEIGIEGEVDPAELPADLAGVKPLTQWYNSRMEDMIRRDPEQYWWLHRRWKGEPPRRRKPAAARAA